MSESLERVVRFNGESVERKILSVAPHMSIEHFLYDKIGLDDVQALEIASQVREAPGTIAETDAVELSLDSVPEYDGGVTRIVDLVLPSPEKITIRSSMIEVFARATEEKNPGLLALSSKQIKESAVLMASAYELGEFVSRKVYDVLVQNYRRASIHVPRSKTEVNGYLQSVLKDFYNRDSEGKLPDDIGQLEPSDAAVNEYFRTTRPRRFYAAGGWRFVSAVDPRVGVNRYQRALRRHHLDNMSANSILPAEDLGSLYPLEVDEFDLLCSFIRRSEIETISDIAEIIPIRPDKT